MNNIHLKYGAQGLSSKSSIGLSVKSWCVSGHAEFSYVTQAHISQNYVTKIFIRYYYLLYIIIYYYCYYYYYYYHYLLFSFKGGMHNMKIIAELT